MMIKLRKLARGTLSALLALSLLMNTPAALAQNAKHERVYTVMGADGTVAQVIDNVRLENLDGDQEIRDRSRLRDIENVGGQEGFQRSADAILWQAGGRDIVYQGIGEDPLPIVPSVTWIRDGRTIDPKECTQTESAQGDVTLRIDLTTTQPMLCVHLLPLPDTAQVVEAKDTTYLTLGAQTLLLGWSVPGVDASLGLPSAWEVTLRLHGEAPEWAMTLASPEVLRELSERVDVSALGVDSLLEGLYGEAGQAADGTVDLTEADELLAQAEALKGRSEDIQGQIAALLPVLKTLEVMADPLPESVKSAAQTAESLKGQIDTVRTAVAETVAEAISALAGLQDLSKDQVAAFGDLQGSGEALEARIQTLLSGLKDTASDTQALTGSAQSLADMLQAMKTEAEETDSMADATVQVETAAEELEKQAAAMEEQTGTLTEQVRSAQDSGQRAQADLTVLEQHAAEIRGAAEQLSDARDHLIGGNETLKTAILNVQSGSEKLNDPISSIQSGIGSTQQEAVSLSDKLTGVEGGTEDLASDLQALRALREELSEALDQHTVSALSDATDRAAEVMTGLAPVQALTADNYAQELQALSEAVSEEKILALATQEVRAKVEGDVEATRDALTEKMTALMRDRLLEMLLPDYGMEGTAAAYAKAAESGKIRRNVQEAIAADLTAFMEDADILATIEEQVTDELKLEVENRMASAQVRQQIDAICSARAPEKIRATLRSLQDHLDGLYALLDLAAREDAAITAAAGHAEAVRGETEAAQAQAGRISEDLKGIQSAADTLSGQLASEAETITALTEAGRAQEGNASALSVAVESLWEKADQLAGGVMTAAEDAAVLEAGLEALKGKAESVEGGSGEMLSKVRALHEDVTGYASEAGKLEEKVRKLRLGVSNLTVPVPEMPETEDLLQRETADGPQTLDTILSGLLQLASEANGFSADAEGMLRDLSALTEGLEAASKAMQSMTQSLEAAGILLEGAAEGDGFPQLEELTDSLKALGDSVQALPGKVSEITSAVSGSAGIGDTAGTLLTEMTAYEASMRQAVETLTSQLDAASQSSPAEAVLREAQTKLEGALTLVENMRQAMAQDAAYDLRSEDMTGDTLYIFRMNLQE